MTHHRVATLGRPGPRWPRAVARWSASATLPLDATTCMTAEELRALVAAQPVGLAIVDAGLPGVDRVLAGELRRAGTALAVVDGPGLAAAVAGLEPDAVLADDFDADALAAVLQAQARMRTRDTVSTPADAPPSDRPLARLVAVTGAPGVGTSTVAQAAATHLAATADTLLADLALDADQHVRHAVVAGAGLFDLAEALRHRPARAVEPVTVPTSGGYALLAGLHRRQEWTVLDPDTSARVVDRVRRTREHVVVDVDADLDGRTESGSVDLEERNALARAALPAADLVVVVGRTSTTGVHRLARLLLHLRSHGLAADRLRPVLNQAGPVGGREAGRALARLLDRVEPGPWARVGTVAHDRRVEACVRDGRPLPGRFVRRVADATGLR